MEIKVAKFGGSSVADAIQLAKVKHIVEADPSRRYVVVSAPGKRFAEDNKITDLLYLCKAHIEHNISHDQVFQVICDRFRSMELNLGVKVDMERHFDEINETLMKGASPDYIASRGEFLSAVLTAAYLEYDFLDTMGLIQFDKRGRLMEEETNQALAEALSRHERAVLPGFYGSDPAGEVKTFSRGGSDVTGALVARAAGAAVYENWTDVPGFLMADPRVVENPDPIQVVSYQELRELSYMGASVLHEDAIYPARAADIPINIRNTNDPDCEGTTILSQPQQDENRIIAGIAGSKDFIVIAIYKDMMSTEVGFVRKILSILEEYNINFEHLPSGIDTISVVINKKKLNGHLEDVLEEFQRRLLPDKMEVFDDMALIATVGSGMAKRKGVSATLFMALYQAGVNIRMIDQGSSEMNIVIGVANDDFVKAIQSIYNAFVSKEKESR